MLSTSYRVMFCVRIELRMLPKACTPIVLTFGQENIPLVLLLHMTTIFMFFLEIRIYNVLYLDLRENASDPFG